MSYWLQGGNMNEYRSINENEGYFYVTKNTPLKWGNGIFIAPKDGFYHISSKGISLEEQSMTVVIPDKCSSCYFYLKNDENFPQCTLHQRMLDFEEKEPIKCPACRAKIPLNITYQKKEN